MDSIYECAMVNPMLYQDSDDFSVFCTEATEVMQDVGKVAEAITDTADKVVGAMVGITEVLDLADSFGA